MEVAGFSGIGHLDLSVSDVETSAAWYERVLGLARCGGWTSPNAP